MRKPTEIEVYRGWAWPVWGVLSTQRGAFRFFDVGPFQFRWAINGQGEPQA